MQNDKSNPSTTEAGDADSRSQTTGPEAEGEESEFKLTIRKLEMPVRPRGVLAE